MTAVTKTLLLVPPEHDRLIEAIAAGANGCILVTSTLADFDTAIKTVLVGKSYCSPDIAESMFQELRRLQDPRLRPALMAARESKLTAREREVLKLLQERKSNKEIAKELMISLFTVKNHVSNILEKLNASNRAEAGDIARGKLRP